VRARSLRALAAGRRVGDFVLESRIGLGGFGEVWRARHRIDGRPAAVKFPRNPELRGALRREGTLSAELDHPLIVRRLAEDLDAEPPWVAFRYVDGPNLRERILDGALPVEDALSIYGDVLAALDHAHRNGVIHGDVKPENILLDADGRAHLADFGIGLVVEEIATKVATSGRRRTSEGISISGTLEYLAPEQQRGEASDFRSDLYTVAMVLFEMLTGALPEGSERPSDLRPGLHPDLDRLVARGRARRDRRYASAAEAIADLDAVLRRRRAGGQVCGACGAPAREAEYFCIVCGAQLRADLERCDCGFDPDSGDRFCIRCGKEQHADGVV